MVRLEFYVPSEHCESVKDAVFAAGAGEIGNYDCCSWETSGTGQFRPCEGSNPYIGEKKRIEKVAETKVEMICGSRKIGKVLAALKKAHPYETPAYQYWPVSI
ncbi:MAG: YqfO family protein [Victivallales bacterium]|nr:YqfO family protein [Victivallales bacterium]